MTNTIEIKSEETGADAPVSEDSKQTPNTPEIELVNQGGVTVARPKQESEDTPSERPESLPEKFKSVEDLAKAYAELEKKLGQPKEKTEDSKENETQQSDSKETNEGEKESEKSEDKTEDAPKTHDLSKFSEEWAEKGELSETSYEELQKLGYPKEFVDTYIEGFQALQDRQVGEVYKTVGGEDNYKSMIEWASNSLSKEEVDAYDSMVTSEDSTQAKLAVKGLWSQYVAANGKQPKLIGGSQGGASSSTSPFRSTAEVVKAMSDPRYANDSAYRKDVEKRLEISDVL
jgi:hypothetical protein